MKRLAFAVLLLCSMPLCADDDFEAPDYSCKGDYCVIPAQILREIIHASRPICQDFNT